MSKHHQRPEPAPAAKTPPAAAWWNNLRRAWLVNGDDGPELVDPQPPPPAVPVADSKPSDLYGHPPAVRVRL